MIKICGLSTPETLRAALEAGADTVGFVHFPPSPRHVGRVRARELAAIAEGRATRVLLLVDPEDADLDAAVAAIRPDVVQLHGRETPERVASVRARIERPVIKAVGIAGRDDLAAALRYRDVADRVLLDAKPPAGSDIPGGHGAVFDWALLAGLDLGADIVLSGGLDPANVGAAVARTGIRAVDVSSGVERRRGDKDPVLIAAFVRGARAAFARADERRRVA